MAAVIWLWVRLKPSDASAARRITDCTPPHLCPQGGGNSGQFLFLAFLVRKAVFRRIPAVRGFRGFRGALWASVSAVRAPRTGPELDLPRAPEIFELSSAQLDPGCEFREISSAQLYPG